MPTSNGLAAALVAAACVVWLSSLAAPAVADGTPSNEDLYRMILELQAGQQELVEQAKRAREDAAQAREQLEATRQELEAARQQLEAREAAGRQRGRVRGQRRLRARGAAGARGNAPGRAARAARHR